MLGDHSCWDDNVAKGVISIRGFRIIVSAAGLDDLCDSLRVEHQTRITLLSAGLFFVSRAVHNFVCRLSSDVSCSEIGDDFSARTLLC